MRGAGAGTWQIRRPQHHPARANPWSTCRSRAWPTTSSDYSRHNRESDARDLPSCEEQALELTVTSGIISQHADFARPQHHPARANPWSTCRSRAWPTTSSDYSRPCSPSGLRGAGAGTHRDLWHHKPTRRFCQHSLRRSPRRLASRLADPPSAASSGESEPVVDMSLPSMADDLVRLLNPRPQRRPEQTVPVIRSARV
jgi:hypothetical protein